MLLEEKVVIAMIAEAFQNLRKNTAFKART